MPPKLEQHTQLIREKIDAMLGGKEAGLVEIFGDDWEQIGTSSQRKTFGRLFKFEVSKGTYPNMVWVRIENAGRFDVYRKL